MLNYRLLIAHRLYRSSGENKVLSHIAIRIATAGVGIGLAVMIVSLCIVLGFKQQISDKVIGFGSHITIYSAAGDDVTSSPITAPKQLVAHLKKDGNIVHAQRVSNKFGIIKTNDDYKGIILKGVGEDFDTSFLAESLKEGAIPKFSPDSAANDIVVSQTTASQMGLKLGDRIYAYFMDQNVKVRRYRIAGIYSSDMQQFDENIIFANMYSVNSLNGWEKDACTSIEVTTRDFNQLDDTYIDVLNSLKAYAAGNGQSYVAYTVRQLYQQIFDWLQLLTLNIWIILALMTVLSALTIISGLLILIMEKTATIGVLSAIGTSFRSIRHIFIYYGDFIILRGVAMGYILGLGLCAIQYNWHFVTLAPDKYYVSYVPVMFDWLLIAALGLGTIIIGFLALIAPSYLISTIKPSKAIKFE